MRNGKKKLCLGVKDETLIERAEYHAHQMDFTLRDYLRAVIFLASKGIILVKKKKRLKTFDRKELNAKKIRAKRKERAGYVYDEEKKVWRRAPPHEVTVMEMKTD